MGRPWGQEVGCSVWLRASRSQLILAGSSGVLILMAAWQAMEAAMRRARVSGVFGLLVGGEGGEEIFECELELAAFEADGSGFDGEGAGAEGLGFEAVAVEFFREGGEADHLGGEEVDEDGHEEALALRGRPRSALAEDFFEEDALVGDVLVDDPEAFVVGGEDEGVADLAEGFEGGEGVEGVGICGLPAAMWASSSAVCGGSRRGWGRRSRWEGGWRS